jgi:two-component system, cell cycle response regulator
MPRDGDILQSKLDALIRMAKSNEQKQNNFQEYELSLFNTNGLHQLLAIVLEQHRTRFKLSDVTLLLLDPEYEFRRLLDNSAQTPAWRKHLLFTEDKSVISQYFSVLRKPRLSNYSKHIHQSLFPETQSLQSVAILPLVRQDKFIGILNLGNRSPDRFQAGMGTQFLQHLAAVLSACIENARLQEDIKQVGLLDPLTSINNRRFFDQRIEEEVTLAHRNKTPLSCLFIDLDHFKNINDTYGHQAGDIVLKEVAKVLADIMRTSDVLARYGGEEFVILLANTDREASYEIAERIRKRIEETPFKVSKTDTLSVTMSIGLAEINGQSEIKTTKQLVNAADQAVYSAKVSGRNRVHHAT